MVETTTFCCFGLRTVKFIYFSSVKKMTTPNVWTNYAPVELPEITKNFDNNLLNLDQKFHILRELKRAAKIPRFKRNFQKNYQQKPQVKPQFHQEVKTNIVPEVSLENQLKDAVSSFKRKPKVVEKNTDENGKVEQEIEIPKLSIADEVPKKLKKKKHNRESCSEVDAAEIPAFQADEIPKKKKKNQKEIPENIEDEIPKEKKKKKHDLENGSEHTNKMDKKTKKKQQIEQESSLSAIELSDKNSKRRKSQLGLEQNLEGDLNEILTGDVDKLLKRKKKKHKKDWENNVESVEQEISLPTSSKDLGKDETTKRKKHKKEKEVTIEAVPEKNSKERNSKLEQEQSNENELPKKKKKKHKQDLESLELLTNKIDKKSKKKGELEQESQSSHEKITKTIEDEVPKDELKEVSTEHPNENEIHKISKKKHKIKEQRSSLEIPTSDDVPKSIKHKKDKEAEKKINEAASNKKPKTKTKKQENCKSIFFSFFGDNKL